MTSIAPRQHIGLGNLAHERELSVFINCPFDPEFEPRFHAIIFATICCGFMPRCAIESGDASVPRMVRIARAVHSSKYSIHDLSRCRGEGQSNLARFNMPLELGIAMGDRFRDDNDPDAHDWLVLVPNGHAYQRAISDLDGYDPIAYDGTKQSIVTAVMSWLATRPDAVHVPKPKAVMAALPDYEAELVTLDEDWGGRCPWSDKLVSALAVAHEAGLIPSVEGRVS